MSQTTQQKYQSLMDKLFQNTMSKIVKWEADILDEDTVSCVIGRNSIELSQGRSNDQSPIVIVSIRDASGKLLDSFNDEDLARLPVTFGLFESYWKLMSELLTMAQRQTNGADTAIDDILKELDEIPF